MEFRLLGTLEVVDAAGTQVEVRGVKLRAVLGALLLEVGKPVSSDRLSEILWGDSPPAGSANALQSQVSKLRRLLSDEGDAVLEKLDSGYVLSIDPASIDAHRFVELARAGRSHLDDGDTISAAAVLRESLSMWRGPALADFVFDDFADTDRIRLDEMRLAAIEDRIEADLANGRHDHVIPELEALVAQSPLRERLCGHLMLALYRSGRQSDALRAFQRTRDHLADELGLDPGPQLRQLENSILDHDPSVDLSVRAPRAKVRRSNLQPELSELFGRGTELDELAGLIASRRLVTLVGPGGVGKTRLATELAFRAGERFPDGAWLVELAGAEGDHGVLDAFVRTFGPAIIPTTDGSNDPLRQLTESLQQERMLIVVDNCEHVLSASAELVTALLRGCPDVTILITSREPLGVPAETVRVVQPLPLSDAAAMFAGRAANAVAVVDISEQTARSIDAICRRVDCIPLSIELAAARLHAFSVPVLAQLLQDQLKILDTTTGGRPTRQQTLQATVDWSYRLLNLDEQRLLARLSIFSGGFTLDAVVAVCSDDLLPSGDVGLLLARLVEKSLVTRAPKGRYHLLAAVAEFAATRLVEHAEIDAMRARHLQWMQTSTAGLTPGLRSAEPIPWAHLMQGEELNLLQTARWALGGGATDGALRIGGQVSWYSFLSANLDQDIPLLLTLLDRADDIPVALRCRSLMWAGLLTIGRNGRRSPNLDSVDTARSVITFTLADTKIDLSDGGTGLSLESVQIARRIGDPALLAEVTSLAAFRLAASGTTPDLAHALADESVALAHEHGDAWTAALGAYTTGLLALGRGDFDRCREVLVEARAGFAAIGDAGTVSLVDASLGEVAFILGDIAAARDHFGRAARFGRAAGFQASMVLRSRLVWLTCCDNDAEGALELGQALAHDSKSLFNPVIRAHSLFALGCAESLAGLDVDAADDLGTALSIYHRFGVVREAALCQTELGYVDGRRGLRAEALEHHRGALSKALDRRVQFEIVRAGVGLAAAHVDHGNPVTAAHLIGFADAKLLESRRPLAVRDRERLDDVTEAMRALLGDAADAERAVGAGLSRADLVALSQ